MAELLGLADGELADPVSREVLADGAIDLRRRHEILAGDVEVAVVLHHPGVLDVRALAAVEDVERVVLEGATDLDRAVSPEVEEDD